MEIKLKERLILGNRRKRIDCEIDNIIVKEDLINPEKETVSVFFKGNNASGILNFKRKEIDKLKNSLKNKTGLIKKVKRIREE